MNAVVAGSRRLPAKIAPRLLVRFLADLPEEATVCLRQPAYSEPEAFESDVEALCRILHIPVRWYAPQPYLLPDGSTRIGREGVLFRDNLMVEDADVVLTFVTDEEAASEVFSGTKHLAEQALNQERVVYLYRVHPDGHVERAGEHDPKSLWAERVPSA